MAEKKSYENFETIAKKLIGINWSVAAAEALRKYYDILESNQSLLAKFESSSNVNSVAEFLYNTKKKLFQTWNNKIIDQTIKKLAA